MIQRRTRSPDAGDPRIDVLVLLGDQPAALGSNLPEFLHLERRILAVAHGGHAGVERGAEGAGAGHGELVTTPQPE